MAVAQVKQRLITGDELLEMGDMERCELIAGEIIKMSPTNVEHGYLENEIGTQLRNFIASHDLGWVFVGEVGIFTRRDPDTVRGADVAFISKERIPKRPRRGFLDIAPELIVEIVSPTDRWTNLQDKIEEYFAIGVQWVWVVEPKRQVIRVYNSPTRAEVIGDLLQGEGVLEGFELSVTMLFAE
jgi:Uma2 family endonuclease